MTIWKAFRVYSRSVPTDSGLLKQCMSHPIGTLRWEVTSRIEDARGKVTVELSDNLSRGDRRAAEKLAVSQCSQLTVHV